MAKWELFKYHPKCRVCMDWVDWPQNYKGLYGILQLVACMAGRRKGGISQ